MKTTPIAMLYRDGTPNELYEMLRSDKYVAEPKLDGVRCLVRESDGVIALLNRKGEPLKSGKASVREKIANDLRLSGITGGGWLLDGELVGNTLWLFDLVEAGKVVRASDPWEIRNAALQTLFDVADFPANIRLVETAFGSEAKLALLKKAEDEDSEGIMLKRIDAPYVSGRSDRGGVKYKRTKHADLIVMGTGFDGKENALLGAFDSTGAIKGVGRASTIGKGPVGTGDVVEVRYLYVGANGRLVQPRIIRVRTDKDPIDCTTDQLKLVA